MRRRSGAKGFTLIELMIVVAIIGLLASIAIPAFVKYIRRAKTTEALMNLRKMFDGSIAYYERDFSTRFGSAVPKQFPAAGLVLAPTPLTNTCCDEASSTDKCRPNAQQWAQPHWQALNFAVDDPHYFWYQYIAAPPAPVTGFTARAQGNLNCNQVYSLFERVGGTPGGDGVVVGGAGVYIENPVE